MPIANEHHPIHNVHIAPFLQIVIGLFCLTFIILYLAAAGLSSRHYKRWPITRTLSWVIGIFCIGAALIGPLAERAASDFRAHMLCHLLLGMLGPLLFVLSKPMTLFLRSINISLARRISRLHKSLYFRIVLNPIVISLLNIGGLWLLYTTDLFTIMHLNPYLYGFIHLHIFLSGYFFTLTIINSEYMPQQFTFLFRAAVLLFVLTFHGILAKYLYFHPPSGVSEWQAEMGAKLMYYGGDIIDIVIIYLLFHRWYKAKRQKDSFLVRI